MSWTCVSCGQTFRGNQTPGITQSSTGRSQCMKCYNLGVPVNLGDIRLCSICKKDISQTPGSRVHCDECDDRLYSRLLDSEDYHEADNFEKFQMRVQTQKGARKYQEELQKGDSRGVVQ